MAKYSQEFKMEIMKYIFEEKNTVGSASKKYNIPYEHIRRWAKRYEMYGVEGLFMKRGSYDGKFKINVVEYMHANHLSLSETALNFGIPQDNIVARWERIYYEEGPQALFRDNRGRKKNMSNPKKPKKLDEKIEKDLIAEVQQLRMENAYLKKLNALVQERIKRENKKK